MDLKTLRERGGIVPSAPVKREMSWTHVCEDDGARSPTRLPSYRPALVRHYRAAIHGQGRADNSQAARFISGSVLLGDDGSEPIPYEVAYQLAPELARVLIEAINEVNGTGNAAPKN
jgi:hypothetical protein